jgi:hypothetical protein
MTLNIVSFCEQQSTAIYIHCVTVWVSSGKKATKKLLLVHLFISVRLSSCNNSLNAGSNFRNFMFVIFTKILLLLLILLTV